MKLRALVGGRADLCGPEMTLAEAARTMAKGGPGALGVIDGRDLVGLLTEHDVLRAVAGGADPAVDTVAAWMSSDPDIFSPELEAEEAARWLLEMGYRHLPVMEDGELLGIVSIRDLLGAITSQGG
ncbi:MAG: CBS domain-containing protein [Acidimicrobiia bacterium]